MADEVGGGGIAVTHADEAQQFAMLPQLTLLELLGIVAPAMRLQQFENRPDEGEGDRIA